MAEEKIKERIIRFCETEKISVRQFEISCGLSNGYVSSMRRGIGAEKLKGILKAYPKLNRNWLLFGEEDMYLAGNTGPALKYRFIFDSEQVQCFNGDTFAADLRESDIQPPGLTDDEVRMLLPGDRLEYTITKDGRTFRVWLTVESRRYTISRNGKRSMVFLTEGLEISKVK